MATPERPSFARREGTFEREPARRVFAAELRETRIHFREGDDEKSPTYVLLPTGERCNRVFLVGTLTEKKKQGEQNMFYRARVVDPTGTFFVMAGSYQPEAMQQIARIDPPAFVAVVGKPNVYETPDGATLISIRCESVTAVDKETRDRWVLDCALATLDRIDSMASTQYGERAQKEYRTDPAVFRKMVFEALSQLRL
ncbi:MAG: nucleic acid-binding protein [Methanoregulaceae archaeon]|nr:nucleic acid-binding protein [Methanoregulaceae archaeon]